MSESDGSAIAGGTDSLAQEIIMVSHALVAVDIPEIKIQFQKGGYRPSFETSDGLGRKGSAHLAKDKP